MNFLTSGRFFHQNQGSKHWYLFVAQNEGFEGFFHECQRHIIKGERSAFFSDPLTNKECNTRTSSFSWIFSPLFVNNVIGSVRFSWVVKSSKEGHKDLYYKVSELQKLPLKITVSKSSADVRLSEKMRKLFLLSMENSRWRPTSRKYLDLQIWMVTLISWMDCLKIHRKAS